MNSKQPRISNFICRGCGSNVVADLLTLDGFPRAAQHFLKTIEQAMDDNPVALNVAECQDCGLVQLKNSPVSYYKDVITAAALSAKSREVLIHEWLPIIERFSLSGKKSIEIGACRGDFLAVLNNLGLDACGLENSEENIEVAKNNGYPVQHGYLIDSDFESEFDLVVCNNYLEHQPDVKTFLRKIKELISEDGLVYFSVPNFEYLLRRSCLYEFVADHLVYFNRKTLKTTFEANGFEVQMQYEKNNGNDLVIISKKAPRLNLQEHAKTMDRVVGSLRLLLAEASKAGKTVASWGAGHRALALLALADATSIAYVVDSAPFKQNLLTPITHLPIRDPDYLIKNKCDILLLMLPGGFALQVQEYLKQNKCNCQVIIFNDVEIDTQILKKVNYGNE
ncbi:MAG: methyltransferase domain-containing protein [Pseudomonadota bacterium]